MAKHKEGLESLPFLISQSPVDMILECIDAFTNWVNSFFFMNLLTVVTGLRPYRLVETHGRPEVNRLFSVYY